MIRRLLSLLAGLALALLVVQGGRAEALSPAHVIVSTSPTTAGWKNVEVIPTGTGLSEGTVVAWSIRANTGCTSTSFVPYLVDKTADSGTGTPSAAPPAEYRIAEEASVTVSASAVEPSFATSFTEVMPYTGGLRLWLSITGGTTCTYVLSVWVVK